MVLPEKLFGVGLTLRSLLSPDGLDAPNHGLQSRGDNSFSTTELARFSDTLKVARDIVEEQKRSDIVEVPTSGLVSILDRIKALEDEVEALINGKKVNTGSKMIESSPVAGSESGSTAASLTSDTASDASTATPSNPGLSPDISPGSSSGGSGGSTASSSSKGSPDGDSPNSQASETVSLDSSSKSIDDQDCAPEHLLHRLGGGSLQRRSMTVSEHPLFRRSTNCNLASVAGGKKVKELPSGAAVFKEGDASAATGSADKSGSTAAAAPADSVTDELSAANPAGDTAVSVSTSMSGSASPEDTVSSAATLSGSEASTNPSETGTDDLTTITTTMTSTIYTTRTIHLSHGTAKASANAKFVNSMQAYNSTGPAVKNGTAIAMESANSASPLTFPKQSLSPLNVTSSDPKAEPLTRKPLFEKNATMPSQGSLTSLTSRLESETSLTASASDTETTAAATIQPLSKNDTATASIEISTIPILTVEIGLASSTADNVTTSLGQAALGKNITVSSLEADTTAVTISVHAENSTAAAMPTDDLSTPAIQSFSTFISPHGSAAAARERLSDPGSSATTVHGSSIISLSPTFTDGPTSTASGSSSSMASVPEMPSEMTSSPNSSSDKEPQTETTTSNMSRAGFPNGTSDDRLSGFKTVTIPRSMSAIAGVQYR